MEVITWKHYKVQFFIEFDVNTKKITFLRKDNIIDYDSDATSIYVRVKYKDLSNNTVYLTPSELEEYDFSLYTIKPTTKNVNMITGVVTDELKENVNGGAVKFEIPRACTNRLGIVKCEIHINQGNKKIGSDTFVLDVKQSLVTAFDDELLGDEDFPVLKQLILEIQNANNINDSAASATTTYSSSKIESIKTSLNSQITNIKTRTDNIINDTSATTTSTYSSSKIERIKSDIDSQIEAIETQTDNIINDTTPSASTTYSSDKIEEIKEDLSSQISAISGSGGSSGGMTSEQTQQLSAAYAHSQSTHAPSNAEANVQSDWNVIDTNSDAYIKNKPTNVSEFTNDANYVTKTYVDTAIENIGTTGGANLSISYDEANEELTITGGNISYDEVNEELTIV